MENKTLKIIILILLVLLILIGSFGALCWWLFTISFIFNPGGDWNLYRVSIPSFLIWLLFIYLWYKWFKKINSK